MIPRSYPATKPPYLNVIPFVVIMILVIPADGGESIVSTQMASAQSNDNNNTATSIGNPFFVEKGRIIGQRVLSVNPLQVEFTVAANATINENINATNTGTTVSTIQPNGVFHAKGQGFIMTQYGETAAYNSHVVGNVTRDGRVLSVGVNFWNAPSTGELAFMNDMMNIFKFQADQSGNISATGWEWEY
jgi:hypothetical protein